MEIFRKILKLCKEHTGWVTTIAALFPARYLLGKEKFMEIAKFWIVKGGIWIPLTVYLILSKLPEFVEFLDRRTETKQRREREEAERKEREEEGKWRGLVEEMGRHKASAKNITEGKSLLYPEDFEKQRGRIIRALEGYGFSVPSEKDLLAEGFDERWFKFLYEGFSEVARLQLDGSPTEERFLKLWEKYKSK